MFIITGNNIKEQKVSILDTEDYKTSIVSYGVLYKAINEGIQVLGVQSGEILCKTDDLHKELAPILQQTFLKAELLKIPHISRLRMLLDVLSPYGLADYLREINLVYENKTIVLKRTATVIHLKNPFVIDSHVPLAYVDEFNKLDSIARLMLMELCKIPIVTTATDILHISRYTGIRYKGLPAKNSHYTEFFYYIKTAEKAFKVGVLPYHVDFTRVEHTLKFADTNSPMFYSFYHKNLANSSEQRSVIISRLAILDDATSTPEGVLIYERI